MKEILRTLIIFATIEIAVVAFTSWSFPRIQWLITWLIVLFLVPIARMCTKWILDYFGMWSRDTWIIEAGKMLLKHIRP